MHAVLPDTNSFAFIGASLLLACVYILIISEWVNRAIVALLGASIAIVLGFLSQEQAIHAIDFNTLGLLAGMMIIVGVARKSGIFGYIAIVSIRLVRGSPSGSLVMLALITAGFSALLDNVTTVLLIVPVTFVVCGELKVPAYPFLFAEILASNIGGTATLIGDPPNILIGSAAGLSYNDFLVSLGPIVCVILAVQIAISHLIWGIKMKAAPEERARVMTLNARDAIADRRLLFISVAVIALVTAAFILHHRIGLEAATIAMAGAALLMLLDNLFQPRDLHNQIVRTTFHEVEWTTLFFFIGLFVTVGALEHAGVLQVLANLLIEATGGNRSVTAIGILWASAIISAIVDNIPFVATMIPMVKSIAPVFGGEEAIRPIWWALALGACLGGNGTLIGASANLAVAGLAEKSGVQFRFLPFMIMAMPMMILSVAIANIYLWWRFL